MDDQGGRSKRQRVDKAAKFEKLKQLKGSKNKYEIKEVENVYEEVDEETYAEKVLERQEDDWIIDDDGAGYVEDGREIFDDDLDDQSISRSKKTPGESRKRGRSKVDQSEVTRPVGGNIRNMFANMPAKKRKESAVNLENDSILGDLIQELVATPDSVRKNGTRVTPVSVKQEVSSQDYLRSFSSVTLKPKPVKITPQSIPKHLTRPVAPTRVKIEPQDNGDIPDIDDNFTEDCGLADVDVRDTNSTEDNTGQIKQEPSDSNPVIDDFDSNDGFSEIALQQMESVIEDSESQATEPTVTVEMEEAGDNKVSAVGNGALWDQMETVTDPSGAEPAVSVCVDATQLPLVTNENGDKVFKFFYWDAYEDVFKQPGTVYLFGKVYVPSADTYVSCCVIMKVERVVYLLPREEFVNLQTGKSTGKPVLLKDVQNEFNDSISTKYKISYFRCRDISKNYAFEFDDVPKTCEYLEIRYSASMTQLPKNLTGETFARVFGTNTSFLELLLLQCKIKGPCWLELKDPALATNPVSFCKIEVLGGHPRNLRVGSGMAAPPPLVLASLSIRTALHPKTNHNEIILATVVLHNKFCVDKQVPSKQLFQDHFCALTRPSDMVFPLDLRDKLGAVPRLRVERCDSERALLCYLLAKLSKADPDLVVGHGLLSGDLDVLIHRLAHLRIPNWSRLGRLRRGNIPPPGKGRFQVERYPMCGRLVCDIKISAKELIKARSYDLGTLCNSVLHVQDKHLDWSPDEVKAKYQSGAGIVELAEASMMASVYVLRLMYEMNVIPLALQITNIAGNVMSRTLMGGRAERNEFLLLHAFTEKDYIVPDKQYGKKNVREENLEMEEMIEEVGARKKGGGGGRKKPSYAGGLVLDPKVGFYDKLILLMDFNSLYPSIIHEYNVCFTTVKKIIMISDEGEVVSAEPPSADEELGILPTEIRKLVESRREVKKMMKSSGLSADLKMQYDIRQMALKLTANSMYGCLGFSNSRFYAKPLAALVTAKGREILTSTKDLVQKLSYEVIYGDTDSIMINTNILDYDQVFKIGNKIKAEVNKMYKHVELDIDGVFKSLLLLKKKKYAAMSITRLPSSGELVFTQEIKGLDIVRRDWSQLAAEAGKFVLTQILTDQEPDERIQNIHLQLNKLRDDLETGKVPLELLTITKQLTKSPDEYSDKKSQPHVQVALRLNSRGARLKSGDTVPYIICEDGTNNPATQRAYHVDDIKTSETLKLDIKYYLSQQVHPVVSRLIGPIEGTDSADIAQSLGLDPSQFKEKPKLTDDFETGESVVLKDEERFRNCKKFVFKCINSECCCEIVVDSPVRKIDSRTEFVLEKCANPDCAIQPVQYLEHIKNCLTLAMRQYITQYYQGILICEDPACPQRTRRLPLQFENKYPICTKCGKNNMYREYTEKQLYTQLSYFQHIWDLSKPPHSSLAVNVDLFNAYCSLREHVTRTLSLSGYSVVNLTKIFSGMFPEPIKVKKEPVDAS